MATDQETTKALEDFETFSKLISKEDKSKAFQLLKQIKLPLVKKYYIENFPADSKEMVLFNCASVIRESLKIEDEYKKLKAKIGITIPFFEETTDKGQK
jgi:hypothetical protein